MTRITLTAFAVACLASSAQAHDTSPNANAAIGQPDAARIVRVAADESKPAQVGALRIEQAWSRATPSGANVGVGYIRVTNTGSTPDRLMGGSADVAARIETHDMTMDNGVMKMRALPDGIEIPPGATLELKPGGKHLMIMGLKQQLKAGDTFPATLRFEKAGAAPLNFQVLGMGATAPAASAAAPDGGHSMHMQAK